MKTPSFKQVSYLYIALLFSLIVLPREGQAQPRPDYLTPELRAKVERLKSDVQREATNEKTLVERTNILWDWANAFALQGGVLPVELPLVVGMVASREGQQGNMEISPRIQVDKFTHELAVKEANPNAVGKLTSSATEPMIARTYQTITQTYTVGDLGMATGGGVLLARHFMSNQGLPYQADKPDVESYVTIKASNPTAKFAPDTQKMSGMHGGFRTTLETLSFVLKEGSLKPGDTVAVTYGDRSGGSPGFRIQSFSNDRFPLPIYVDQEGKGNFFTLPIFPHKVIGTKASGVHGFAPSIVGNGEKIEISIRSEDPFANRASGPIPGYTVTANGKALRAIPAGNEPITLLKDIQFDEPGVYRLAIASVDGSIKGDCNPILVEKDPKMRIYWGEMHGHCGFAEGQGTPDGFFTFGRDDARLDFITLTEHDLWMDDLEWKTLKELTTKYHKEGSFITFSGHEWTQDTARGGHHNVFFRTPEARKRANVQRAPMLSDLYQTLRMENKLDDVLVVPHAHEAGEWRMNDPELEKLVEISSMHGTFEWYGRVFVDRGLQMGFIAAADDHLSHPGYSAGMPRGLFQNGGLAAVMTPTKTNDAIFDSLRGLATYATTGERPILKVELNGKGMGERAPLDTKRHLHGRVIGTSPIDSVVIFKNGKPVYTEDNLVVKQGTTQNYLASFYSESDPLKRGNPRAAKTWNGALEIKGAKLKSARFLRRSNAYLEKLSFDAAKGRVDFTVMTRGRDRAILLELEGASAQTSIESIMDQGVEMSPGTAVNTILAQIPGSTKTLAFRELKEGRLTLDYPVLRYTDTLTLRAVKLDGPMEREFDFVDEEKDGDGDFYFVRSEELSGALAWSSPIWVGGFPTR